MQTFLSDYTLLDELGQGGFAKVYKVRHNNLGYVRAIRVLNETIAKGESDPAYQKFLRECRLLLRLGNGNHPNIVHIYQPLLREGKALVEMDYIDGESLCSYLKRKKNFIETDEVLRLVEQMSSALAYCHVDVYKYCMDREVDHLQSDPEDGSKVLIDEATKQRLIGKYQVIHNDLHSGNIMRRENGTFVLLDFGLSIDGNEVLRSSRRHNGAPEYKSPEKWADNNQLSTQSDIYSFGVILYEVLAGRVPFVFDKGNSNVIEAEYLLSKAHCTQKPQDIYQYRKEAFEATHPGKIYQKDYPEWLEKLIMRCLEKNPSDRFADGAELLQFVQGSMKSEMVSVVMPPTPPTPPTPPEPLPKPKRVWPKVLLLLLLAMAVGFGSYYVISKIMEPEYTWAWEDPNMVKMRVVGSNDKTTFVRNGPDKKYKALNYLHGGTIVWVKSDASDDYWVVIYNEECEELGYMSKKRLERVYD